MTTLKKLVTRALVNRHVSQEEAGAIKKKVLENGKVSRAEEAQVLRALRDASSFDPGAKEVLSDLLCPKPNEPSQMTLAQAKTAATALGLHLDAFRREVLALQQDMNDPATFEAVLTERFGPGTADPLPGQGEENLTLTPIWPGVAPYPRIKIDARSGQLYFNDSSLSSKWFGPRTPPPEAKVLGTFADENDRFEIYQAYLAGEHGKR